MDIENMQKINRLAKELFQHGVAPDMEEATKQAELMINRGDKSISDVMNVESRFNPSKSPEEEHGSRSVSLKEELNAQLRMMASQINEQSRAIKVLMEQLEGIKLEMSQLKTAAKEQPVMLKMPYNEQTHLKKDEVKKPAPHPRVGNYESSDVSIEKFFYAGPPK